ncbi:hypothetical protein LFL96_06470 [Paraburkholderia sp. D15]|uniref:hypothetical protein n=1 Tax=Paraburkholderia sp. D15 TaxID=2880218 RepID=UPI00247B23E4|nr:hypothetical protein [Paraburkholderia sp. D15]WGS51143.1 hypothetical protein LFL96_06470 [Paraburkholderia sp. D15]WKF59091.1 hypothetical protein HUO10_003600 [Paraburkholderia busanensis]
MDRKKVYEIFPQTGVAEIRFGMSPDEVERFWGAPSRKLKNFLGNRSEVRDAELMTYAADETVAEIGFPSSYANVTVQGVQIFQQAHSRTISELHALDSDAYEGDGFIVFRTLGVSLSGFRGDDFKALTVTAFRIGWWDESLKDMAPMTA